MKNLLIIFSLILFSSCTQNTTKESTNLVAKDCLANSTFCFPDCETPSALWSFTENTFKFKSKEGGTSIKGEWKENEVGVIELKVAPNDKQGENKKIERLKLSNCESFMFAGKKYMK